MQVELRSSCQKILLAGRDVMYENVVAIYREVVTDLVRKPKEKLCIYLRHLTTEILIGDLPVSPPPNIQQKR